MKLEELFESLDKDLINEGVGIIVKGVNTTADVGEDETRIQAEKFGNKLDDEGEPPSYWESHKLAARKNK